MAQLMPEASADSPSLCLTCCELTGPGGGEMDLVEGCMICRKQ